jgi:TonB-linked SusC/RagA family outer membrane protein
VITANLFAQNIQVSGTVTDAGTGEPIAFASLQIKGTSFGTTTDDFGKYTISAPSDGVLIISFVGYQNSEVAINGKSVVDVVLSIDAESLEEVVMVAYGTAKKSSFTGSAATVKSESITKRSVSNVTKAIEGLVAGVTSTSGNGQPGEGASIQIRGYGSINASSSPLYVVDGIPFDGNMASINPNDIENMTVLKDASASALYGSRGANGVVMITTKRGSDGHTNVNFKAQVGWQSRSLKAYDMVNQDEFVELTYESLKNQYYIKGGYSMDISKENASADMGKTMGGELYNPYKNYTWDTVIDPSTGKVRSDAISAWNENWMDELTNTKALRQEYQVGLTGGNEKTKYALSVGYLNDMGVLVTTKFARYSARANVDHKVNKWLAMGLNSSYSYTDSNQSQYSDTQTGNAWYTAQFMAPIYPVYAKNLDGTNALDENGNKLYDYGENGRPKASKFNVVGDLYDNQYRTTRDNAGVRSYITLGGNDDSLGAIKGLTLSVNFGADLVNRNITSYYNPYHGDGTSTKGSVSKYNTRTFSYTLNQVLKYDRTFGEHHVLAQVGHEYYDYGYNYLYAERTNIYPGITELAPAVNVSDNNSYSNAYHIESYFSRLAYDYADKYYVEGTWRTDGSSRFYKDNRWGQFWSVGATWRLSEENWMKSVSWIDNMSLRASYGQLGNDGLDTFYAWQSFYNLEWANATNSGALVSSLENKNVTWEKKKSWNFGIEGTMFNKILNFTVEYYRSNTDDMLLAFPMPMSTGFTGYNANVGSMQNNGVEATIRVNWLQKSNFRASSTIMLYKNYNKVTKLTEDDTITSGIRVIKVGMPIYTYYMTKCAGVDPATGNQLYWAYKKDEKGDKIDGSDYITSNTTEATESKYYLGSRDPKIQGSFGTDMQIGPVDFSFLTTFSVGGQVYESVYQSAMEVTYGGDTWSKNILRRWQKPGDVTDVPAVMIGSGRLSNVDKWLVDASYFAIKSIQLGYTLPQKWTNKANIKGLRIFVNGDNIALFNKLNGMNNQYNFTGGANWSYTPTRTFSVGIDINF